MNKMYKKSGYHEKMQGFWFFVSFRPSLTFRMYVIYGVFGDFFQLTICI